MDGREAVDAMLRSEGPTTPHDVQRELAEQLGAVSILFNSWFIDVDEARERVHVYHESIPHLDAEMSVDEFFAWCDEILGS